MNPSPALAAITFQGGVIGLILLTIGLSMLWRVWRARAAANDPASTPLPRSEAITLALLGGMCSLSGSLKLLSMLASTP